MMIMMMMMMMIISIMNSQCFISEDSVATLSVVDVSDWASGPEVPNVSLVPWTADSVSMVTEVSGLQKQGGVSSRRSAY